jgi:hypothetical protein
VTVQTSPHAGSCRPEKQNERPPAIRQDADNARLGIFASDTPVTGNTIAVKGKALGIHAEGPLLQSNLIKDNTLSLGTGGGILVVASAPGGSGTIVSGNTISGFKSPVGAY